MNTTIALSEEAAEKERVLKMKMMRGFIERTIRKQGFALNHYLLAFIVIGPGLFFVFVIFNE